MPIFVSSSGSWPGGGVDYHAEHPSHVIDLAIAEWASELMDHPFTVTSGCMVRATLNSQL